MASVVLDDELPQESSLEPTEELRGEMEREIAIGYENHNLLNREAKTRTGNESLQSKGDSPTC